MKRFAYLIGITALVVCLPFFFAICILVAGHTAIIWVSLVTIVLNLVVILPHLIWEYRDA